ncbi:MAG: heme NO-binding domain-containing protein [Rhodobacteraceae bacterium]|nr:heme NO-binding domain-containing protein [Paracoccaceae bacterium]
MHGLINRSLQFFLRDTYGAALWSSVAEQAGVPPEGFEAMLTYEDALTDRLLAAAAVALSKPREALLEDLGMFLVSLEPLRRLLRFGGVDYVDFLHSLDELPDRARLAVADIGLPDLELTPGEDGSFRLISGGVAPAGFLPVMAGVLRAMADDYGAFALVDMAEGGDAVQIELLQTEYSAGRSFDLARPEVA